MAINGFKNGSANEACKSFNQSNTLMNTTLKGVKLYCSQSLFDDTYFYMYFKVIEYLAIVIPEDHKSLNPWSRAINHVYIRIDEEKICQFTGDFTAYFFTTGFKINTDYV